MSQVTSVSGRGMDGALYPLAEGLSALAWESDMKCWSGKFGRWLSAGVLSVGLVGGALVAGAAPASADATGTAYFGGIGPIKGIPVYDGSYWVNLQGSGSFISGVVGIESSWGNLCNWDITAELFDANWNWHQTRVSSHHYGCDHQGSDWISIDDQMQNLVGSPYGYMCSTLRVAGQRVTSVCHYVHP